MPVSYQGQREDYQGQREDKLARQVVRTIRIPSPSRFT